MRITAADLDDPRVIRLLEHHVASARAETSPGSDHALDPAGLQSPDIEVWAMWDGDALLGVGALKRLSPDHGEVKSMHTAEAARRRGLGGTMLRHILSAALGAGIKHVSLETGSWDYFAPARALYRTHGFRECGPFGDYTLDPNSVFMTLELAGSSTSPRPR